MADVKFDIEVTGIKELKQAADDFNRLGKVSSQLAAQYKPLGAQTTKLVAENTKYLRVQKQLAAAVAQGIITEKEATRAQKEALRSARERLLTDKTLIDQAKKRQKAAEADRKETERLTQAYAPARVAADLYQKKVREIQQAEKRNIITKKEAQQALSLLTKEYYDFTQGVATGGNQFAKFNVETYRANQRIKRFTSTGLQQAGYQFGDFAVQVQSGTNVAVAFGQQMSQLLGIFGATGAIAGAGVAIATAFIAPLIDAKKEAEGLNINIDGVFNTLQENQSAVKELLEISLVGPLEQARLKAIAVLEAFRQIDLRDTKTAVSRDIQDVLKGLEELSKAAERVSTSTGVLGIGSETEGRRTAAAAIKEDLDALIISIGQAATGPAEDLPKRLTEAFLELEKSGLATEEILKSFKELLQNSGAFATYQEEIRKAQEASAEASKKRSEEEEKFIQTAISNRKREEKEAQKITETEKLRRKLSQERLETARKAEGALERVRLQRLKKLQAEEEKKEEVRLQNAELAAQQEFALRFKNESDLLQQKVEVSKDLLKVIDEDSKEAAARIKANFENQDFLFKVRFADETGLFEQPVTPTKDAGKGATDAQEKARKEAEKQAERVRDYIKSLENQFEIEESLIGIFGEQRDLQEALIQARQEYGDTATAAQMKTIEGYIQETHALEQQQKALEKAKQQQEQLKEAIVGSMENAFMSIVDGTKTVEDAFRTMAAEIIKELYRVLVVKKTVEAITAVLPFAKGGVISNGNVVPYANGGVVGSPTYFPMSGGRTGLMGEAGPEAIMPLKRGKNGKLGVESSGQGDNIVVNQSFNFQANGDDSVKRIIAKEAPKIAHMTQQQIMESRRRGGQMKAVFG